MVSDKGKIKDKLLIMLTFIIVIEGFLLLSEIYSHGYTNKGFTLIGFMIIAKLSQIQTIITYK